MTIRLFIILLLAPFGAFAQMDSVPVADNFHPSLNPPAIHAIEAAEVITVDGILNEAIWQQAPVISNFFRMEPRQGGKYLYKTFVQVVYDKRNLYFGVFCKDSLGTKGLRAQDLRRDFTFSNNDAFEIQLDPQNLKRYCVSFQTTPYGNQSDLQAFDDTNRDSQWDALWKVRTARTDSGWYAEFAIPFKSLRYDRDAADAAWWGITLARLARRDYELTAFPAIPQSFSPFRMTYAAQLKGLKLPPPSANIRLQPYTLYQYNTARDADNIKSKNAEFKPGGEIKWAINPRAVLDLTFNTDFAQADVDVAVNNLTRFNVLFPERRQFFLENSGVYAGADVTNIKPFFSRTIGLSNEQFNAETVPIDAGIRYTDRTRERTIAGLYVHQRATGYQSAVNFGLARYLKNYGTQNNVGLMLTHRLDESDVSKGFQQRNNSTVTVDGLIRPKNDITIQYLASAARNNSNDSIGLAGSFYAGYFPNKWYFYYWTDIVSEKYLPGMGYVFADNTIRQSTGGYYIWRPKGKLGKHIRRFDPGVFATTFNDYKGLGFQQAELYFFPVYIILQSGGFIQYAYYLNWQNINFPFYQLSIPLEQRRYYYTRHQVDYNTDQSRKLSLASRFTWGNYYNGRMEALTLTGRVAPLPHVAITCTYQHNNFRSLGINHQGLRTDLITASLRLAYNPRIQASVFYQYNSFDKRGRWNVRGSWEFAPLSFLYLVFNETSFQDSPIKNQSVISKLTYLKQF
ncbi:MAG: carbohydrate binding family 9 domain-containing protein [Chitinophagaceae bacterium]|nr:carbohydrate binding family 9 domain-containing protein [Chitinophagaceae bacterium]MCW5928905.1 carbohydrate binding family 9 domain-containing protein [Chitinophagaceae bacterium]